MRLIGRRRGTAFAQRGLSMIELLVGLTVALFLLAGVIRFFTDFVNDNRRLLLETRISQDLRTIADLMVRDLRRAGFWREPLAGVTAPGASNPYVAISPAGAASSSTITYSYSRDATENNTLDVEESFGFRLSSGVVEARNAAGEWRPLSDPTLMSVNTLEVTPVPRCVSLSSSCKTAGLADACTAAGASYPKLWIRQYRMNLVATAAADSRVVRRVVDSVRVRNDWIENQNGCPP